MVRVGGGFLELKEYIIQDAKSECLKLLRTMEKNSLSLFETLRKLIESHTQSEEVFERFEQNRELL